MGGFLCVNGFDGGWPSIFYVFGAAGLLWSIVWFLILSDSPRTNRFIKDREKYYILDVTKDTVAAHAAGESVRDF